MSTTNGKESPTPPWAGLSPAIEGAYLELMTQPHAILTPAEYRRTIITAVLLGRQIETELSAQSRMR